MDSNEYNTLNPSRTAGNAETHLESSFEQIFRLNFHYLYVLSVYQILPRAPSSIRI